MGTRGENRGWDSIFILCFHFFSCLATLLKLFFRAVEFFCASGFLNIYKLGLTKLGGQFWNIFFWADSTWGTVSGFQFIKFYGGIIKGTSFGLFLANSGLGTFEGLIWKFFGHTLKLLGTFFFLWAHLRDQFGLRHISRAHFKDLVGLSLKRPCHKAFVKDFLNPKHLGMLK